MYQAVATRERYHAYSQRVKEDRAERKRARETHSGESVMDCFHRVAKVQAKARDGDQAEHPSGLQADGRL